MRLLDCIVEVASTHNCKLLVNSPFKLYKVESSYGYIEQNKNMHVALHVPVVEEGQVLGLKIFFLYPLKQLLKVNATVIPEAGNYQCLAVILKKGTSPKDSFFSLICTGY
jgi:hypothetical protein